MKRVLYLLKMSTSNKNKPVKQYAMKCTICGAVNGFSLSKNKSKNCRSH